MTGPQPGHRPEDLKRALLEAAQAAVTDAEHKADEARRSSQPRRARLSPMIAAAIASGIGLYLLVARPAWFVTPPPPPDPPAIAAASVRLTLAREANRVHRFLADSGRLPASMAEAGSTVSAVEYERLNDSGYVLRAVGGSGAVRLSSRDSLPLFIGNSLRLIMARGQP